MMDSSSPVLFAVQFVGLFLAAWCLVSVIGSLAGGWFFLARHYRLQTAYRGPRWRWRSGLVRVMYYRFCLTLGSDANGLMLATLWPFRIGHPPLLVPWSEITVAPERMLVVFPMVKFTFRQSPSIPLMLPRGLARELAAASGGALSLADLG